MNAITPNVFAEAIPADQPASLNSPGRERETGQTPDGLTRPEEPFVNAGGPGTSSAADVAAGANAGNALGMRVLRIVIALAVYFVLEIVVKVVTVLQLIYVAWKKHPNPGMQRLGAMIGDYTNALWRYCTFASQEAPWPFNPWPRDPSGTMAP